MVLDNCNRIHGRSADGGAAVGPARSHRLSAGRLGGNRARLAPIRTEAASGAQCERARSGDRSIRGFAGDRSVRSGAAPDVRALPRSRRTRGQALVEPALVLPMLFLLVFATI